MKKWVTSEFRDCINQQQFDIQKNLLMIEPVCRGNLALIYASAYMLYYGEVDIRCGCYIYSPLQALQQQVTAATDLNIKMEKMLK